MNVDETNMKLVKHLRDGRKSFKEVATSLSITENTVRARVRKLIKKSILHIMGLVDPDKIPNHYLALVGVKLQTMHLVKKGEEFSKLKGVVSVGVVTGRFDLILTVLLNNKFDLLEFYTKEVSKIKDVLSTETFVLYKNFNWRVPYIL
ncbi:Lrp/AsnC family transcriptional regulator [Candidatus Poribacteria bacterium]|nr:Lrp/AsnC family transcriptional regulator [Candidatus Poribacteria bacterium]